MSIPLQKGLRTIIGIFLLVFLPLAGNFAIQSAGKGGFAAISKAVILEDLNEELDTGTHISALDFEFANWIPEAIRSVNIRFTTMVPTYGGIEIFFTILPLFLIIFPLHRLVNFSVKPDFVGFLFRLKPF